MRTNQLRLTSLSPISHLIYVTSKNPKNVPPSPSRKNRKIIGRLIDYHTVHFPLIVSAPLVRFITQRRGEHEDEFTTKSSSSTATTAPIKTRSFKQIHLNVPWPLTPQCPDRAAVLGVGGRRSLLPSVTPTCLHRQLIYASERVPRPADRLQHKHNPAAERDAAHVWARCLPSSHQADWSQAESLDRDRPRRDTDRLFIIRSAGGGTHREERRPTTSEIWLNPTLTADQPGDGHTARSTDDDQPGKSSHFSWYLDFDS